MRVARVTEISATSSESFRDAVRKGVRHASETHRDVRSARVREQQVRMEDGRITEYRVNILVTFVPDD